MVVPIQKAKAAGIPVLPSTAARPVGAEDVMSVLSDNEALGEFAAQNIIEGLKAQGRDSGNIIVLTGTKSMLVTQDRMKGFNKVMATAPQYKVIEEQDANWDPSCPATIAQQLFAKYGCDGIQAAYGMADYMALPIVQAAKQAGFQIGGKDGLIVTSGNCFKVGIDSIKAGELYGTATEDPGTIANQTADYVGGTSTARTRRRASSSRRTGSPPRTSTSSPSSAATRDPGRRAGPRFQRSSRGAGRLLHRRRRRDPRPVRPQRRRQEHRGEDAVRPAGARQRSHPDRRRGGRAAQPPGRPAGRRGAGRPGAQRRTGVDRLENMLLGDIDVRSSTAPGRRPLPPVLDDMGLERIEPDQPLSTLSIGERQLIEIAKALSQHARLVILDEPTATLSDVESQHVFAAIRRVAATGCSVIFVSHRLSEVLELCDRSPCSATARVATTPAADLTVDQLIVQMLGEAPHRLAAQAAPDRDRRTLCGSSACGARPARDFSLTAQAGRSTRSPASSAAARPTRCEPLPGCTRRRPAPSTARPASAVPRPGGRRAPGSRSSPTTASPRACSSTSRSPGTSSRPASRLARAGVLRPRRERRPPGRSPS